MTAYADTGVLARTAWQSRYPFEPYNGGQGATLAVTTASGRVALLGASPNNVICVTNTGSEFVFVRYGDSTVTADTGCYAIGPGIQVLLSLPPPANAGQVALPTHIAAVTSTGTTAIQVSMGYGN